MRQLPPGTRALRSFEAAGRHLNFTRAADELGLTPAAVSHQIKEMEEQLGLVLFTRNSRSMQLTPAGSVLLEATAEALGLLRRATGRARQLARGETRLRLSLGARFATQWLLLRLPRFRAAHPQIELSFDINDEVRDFDADDIDAAIRFGTGRILFMDDDPKICELTGAMIASLDYTHDVARNGDEALQLYRRYLNVKRPYDAVLLDLTVIGGMGGEECFKRLRELDPEVRAIVTSGYDDDDMIKRYLEMGFVGYITKPYRVGDLGRVLKSVLGAR